MQRVEKNKQLVVSTLKQSALKDCTVTAPDMIAATFSESSIIESFVSAGMIDM